MVTSRGSPDVPPRCLVWAGVYLGRPSGKRPTANFATSCGLPANPELVMLTNVVPSGRAVNTHSMSVGAPGFVVWHVTPLAECPVSH